jgi:hypothetical protein
MSRSTQQVPRRLSAVMALAILLSVPPALAAEPPAAGATQRRPQPDKISDIDLAIKVWKTRPAATETTAAMRLRVRKELAILLQRDPKKMDPDTGMWKLLDYLRAFPWDRMPSS